MYRLMLAAVACIVSCAATAEEESKLAIKKWRACDRDAICKER
jgi:hypothetical protein